MSNSTKTYEAVIELVVKIDDDEVNPETTVIRASSASLGSLAFLDQQASDRGLTAVLFGDLVPAAGLYIVSTRPWCDDSDYIESYAEGCELINLIRLPE